MDSTARSNGTVRSGSEAEATSPDSSSEATDENADFYPSTGIKDRKGRIVKTVFGPHSRFWVYTTECGHISWWYDHLPVKLRPGVGEFALWRSLARSSLPSRLQGTATEFLAAGLYNVLLTPEDQNPQPAFETAKKYILRKSAERARLYYVLLSLSFAMLFGGVAYVVIRSTESANVKTVATGIGAGVLGAAISIVQRGWKLPVDPLDSIHSFAAQGFVRVILGALFGAVFVVLSRANLAFGTIANNSWALFALAVAAGISERFVPDLLDRSARTESSIEESGRHEENDQEASK